MFEILVLALARDFCTNLRKYGRKYGYKFAFISSQCSVIANQTISERLYKCHFVKYCRYFTYLFF